MTVEKKRDAYVDVAKGICILLIVCIHAEVFGVIGMPITFIAVPMFFFMSGFYDRTNKPFIQWFPKALRTLIVPAVIWIIVGGIFHELLQFIKTRQIEPITFDYLNPCTYNGPAWFLFALLYAKILTWFLPTIKIPIFLMILLSLFLGYLGSTFQMPMLIDEGFAAFPLYLSGKLLYPYLKRLYSNYLMVILGLLSLSTFLFSWVSYTIVPIDNGLYQPLYIVALVAINFVFFPVLLLSSWLQRCSMLQSLGSHSLGIMLLHAPMCHTAAVILNRLFDKGSMVWIVLFMVAYIAIVFISYFITLMIEKKMPFLLGKKRKWE